MTKYGYRANMLYTGEDYDMKDVIIHEVVELENEDILDYLTDKGHMTYDEITTDEEAEKAAEAAALAVRKAMNTDDPLYAFWMCDSKEDVAHSYLSDDMDLSIDQKVITEYILPSDAFVISDLECDGKLYASKVPLSQLEQKTL